MTNDVTMRGRVRAILLVLLAMLPTTARADPSAEALAFTCAGCHGTDGSSVGPSSPSIAGMDPQVFIDAMVDYKADLRNSTIMNRIAKGYSQKQIVAMAVYFSRQKLRTQPQPTDPSLVAEGKKLHDQYCEKCHEHGGKPGDAGTLAGQWMPYLEFSMLDFLGRERRWPWRMRQQVEDATAEKGEKAVQALLHFYASQHQD
jgi:sulfide dehydrogenase cytochrome subunit